MSESAIKTRTVSRLRAAGYFAVRIAASPFQMAGLPDILVLLKNPPGRAFWIEMKVERRKPTPLQKAKMEELERHGALCVVAYSAEESLRAVHEAEGGRQ